jgi:KDO2-lipid IV(A) lauroyltransferase
MGERRKRPGPERIRFLLELELVNLTGWLIRLLPYGSVVNLADLLGVLAFDVVRIRRKVTLANLKLAFGKEKSAEELKKIGRRSYQIIARAFVEHLYLPRLNKQEIFDLVEFNSLNPFRKAIQEGKGAVLASAHFGSWQLMGVAVAQHDLPMNFLVQQQRNEKVDRLAYSYVQDKGVGVLYRRFSARKVLDLLKQNKLVAMLPDQDAGRKGVIVKFFGQPVSVHRGPAYFAMESKAPIITGFIVQNSKAKKKAYIQEPYYPILTGDEEKDAQTILQEITFRIEEFVRKYPEHWFWPHRRWKSTLGKHELQ